MTMNSRFRVALVGPMQQDNLPLGYLASSLESAGYQTHIVRFDTHADTGRCVDEVLALSPQIVGLGIAFQYAVGDYQMLASELRKRGFVGHITCGGHVPTFNYREILSSCSAIDTIVRHEGEETIVALANALSRQSSFAGIQGLVWRNEKEIVTESPRLPVQDLDTLPWPKRRPVQLRAGGVPVGFVLSSRGCVGDCAYCSIRAFGRDAGGMRYRLRRPASIADEIAQVRRTLGVRVFFVQDDLFVLPSERKATERIDSITAELAVRGIFDVAFWIKGRPESITHRVLDSARRMGAIHIFLGIENASDERLRYLGRTHTSAHNRSALALCKKSGIRPSFNFMLFDPDCTLSDLRLTMDLARENLDMPWNVCRTEIYSGTRLADHLKNEGRLEGDYRTYGYTMRDIPAEIAFRIMRVSLHDHALSFDSLLNKLIALSFARQIHQTLFPGPESEELNKEVDALVIDTHRDTVASLGRIIEVAESNIPSNSEEIRAFAIAEALELGQRDAKRILAFREIWDKASARGEKWISAGSIPARRK